MLKLWDILRISMRQAVRQRRRYLGVILAITLGTAGFVTIVTMGRNVKITLNEDLDLLGGATRVKLYFDEPATKQDLSAPQWFRPATLDALRSMPGVRGVSVAAFKKTSASSGSRKGRQSFTLMAVDEHFWEVNSFSPASGTLFPPEAVTARKRVCVLGADLARKIFGRENVAGSLLQIERDLYEVTGVLGGAGIGDRVNYAFLPMTTARDRVPGLAPPNTAYLRCRTWDDVEHVASGVPERVLSFQPAERLRVDVAWEQLTRVRKVGWWMELFIYVSIAATLILGGFGMWSGMMSAVQARTREIGLKKAIGAESRHIMAQFLCEALFLSLSSGLLGIALGRVAIECISIGLGSDPPAGLFRLSVAMSLVVSCVLGVAAGLMPSLRGSRMEVVSALRYE